jgi:hypothetical protein
MDYIGFIRLGTSGEKVSPDADLARQREGLAWWIRKNGGGQVGEYIVKERSEEGALIAEALKECRRLRARLVIPELCRPRQARDLMDALVQAQTQFNVIRVTDEPTRRLVEMLNASAKRNQEKRARRAKDSAKVGNPHGTRRDGTPALSKEAQAMGRAAAERVKKDKADAFALKLQPIIKKMLEDGMTKYAVAKELNSRKTKTASGKVGAWDERKVTRVLEREVTAPYVLEENWKKGWKRLWKDQANIEDAKRQAGETAAVRARGYTANRDELDRLSALADATDNNWYRRKALALLKRM